MAIQHSAIQSADCHEPKHITSSGTSDAGKVITPSAVSAGTSTLRLLVASEVTNALDKSNTAGQTTSGKLNINHAGGLEVQGTKVVGAQGAAVADAAALTSATLTDSSGGVADTTIAAITNAANPGSADVGPTANAIADLAAQVNALRVDLTSTRAQLNTALARLRAHGLIVT